MVEAHPVDLLFSLVIPAFIKLLQTEVQALLVLVLWVFQHDSTAPSWL